MVAMEAGEVAEQRVICPPEHRVIGSQVSKGSKAGGSNDKTMRAEDVLNALTNLGLKGFVPALNVWLERQKAKEGSARQEKKEKSDGAQPPAALTSAGRPLDEREADDRRVALEAAQAALAFAVPRD